MCSNFCDMWAFATAPCTFSSRQFGEGFATQPRYISGRPTPARERFLRTYCAATAPGRVAPEPGELGRGGIQSPQRKCGTIIVPGKFDAFHLGHRELARSAATMGSPVLLSFSGMAEALKWSPRAPVLAAVERDRVLRSWSLAIGEPVTWRVLPFGEIRDQTPEQFLDMLVAKFDAKGIVCGADWRFGRRAAGDVMLLRELAPSRGLEVRVVEAVDAGDGGGVISSTRVRSALASGEVAEAARLLGRPHRLVGYVASVNDGLVNCNRFVNQVPGNGIFEALVRVIGRAEPFHAVVRVRRPIGFDPLTPLSVLDDPDAVVVQIEDAEQIYCDDCEVYLDFIERTG